MSMRVNCRGVLASFIVALAPGGERKLSALIGSSVLVIGSLVLDIEAKTSLKRGEQELWKVNEARFS